MNLTNEHVAGAWRLPFAVEEARLSRLDETVGAPASIEGQDVTFTAEPRDDRHSVSRSSRLRREARLAIACDYVPTRQRISAQSSAAAHALAGQTIAQVVADERASRARSR